MDGLCDEHRRELIRAEVAALESERDALRTEVGRLGRLVEQAEARVGEFRGLAAARVGECRLATHDIVALTRAGDDLEQVLRLTPRRCESLHHATRDQHASGQCPVEATIERVVIAWRKATGRES